MKKTQASKSPEDRSEDMRAEYHFDYGKARPNRFAGRATEGRVVVILDPDVARVFTTAEAVNNVLRALIANMPHAQK